MPTERPYGFTCHSCGENLDTPFTDSDRAHEYAQQKGWRYIVGPGGGIGGWGPHVTCPPCADGADDAVPLAILKEPAHA